MLLLLTTILAACVSEIDKPHPEIHPYAEKDSGEDTADSADTADTAESDALDVDNDGDGWTENEGDCDDTDVARSPESEELNSNDIDDNCDEFRNRYAYHNGISATDGNYRLDFLMVDDNYGIPLNAEGDTNPTEVVTNHSGWLFLAFHDHESSTEWWFFEMQTAHCAEGASFCATYSTLRESGGEEYSLDALQYNCGTGKCGYNGDPSQVAFVYVWKGTNTLGCTVWGDSLDLNTQVQVGGAEVAGTECSLSNPTDWKY